MLSTDNVSRETIKNKETVKQIYLEGNISSTTKITFLNTCKNKIEQVRSILNETFFCKYKEIKHYQDKYKITYNGLTAKLLYFWLFNNSKDKDIQLLSLLKATVTDKHIIFPIQFHETLRWCKIAQKLLSFKTTPVFHNKGKKKYYMLYIHEFTNT